LAALATLDPEPVPDWMVSALSPTAAGFDEVVAAGLLQPVGTDALGVPTYQLSPLVRRYLDARVPLPFTALERMASGWLSLLAYASEALPVGFFSLETAETARRAPMVPAAPVVECARRNAVRWLESEQSRLVAVTEQAAAAGAATVAVDLAVGLVSFFELRANVDDWRRTHRAALQAAVAAGDKRGEATILRGLGQLDLYADAYASATGKFHRSLTLFTELEDSRGAAAALSGLGAAHHYDKNDRMALDFYRLALKLYEKSGNAHGVAYARAAIGLVGIGAGDTATAKRWLDRARQDAIDINDHNRSAQVLHKLGMLMHRQSDPTMASAYQHEAMNIFAGLGNDLGVANTKLHLGRLSAERGAAGPAISLLEETLPTYRTLGDRRSEVDALLLLSDLNESERRAGPAWRYRQRAAHLAKTLRADF
jgi:tetratricopeptide (TPR) repeat protein